MGWTWRSEYVRCGKKNCKSCPHGPYWYGYRKIKGKMHKTYGGKTNPFASNGEDDEVHEANGWDAIHNRATANVALATHILGVPLAADFATCKAAARKLLMANHPDRGGDNKRYCHINSAWTWLKGFKGWH